MTYYSIDHTETAATGTHLTNASVDNYLKVEFDVSAENDLIDSMTKAAEAQAEKLTNLCVNTKTVTVLVTDIETDNTVENTEINLPYRGTYAITSVEYMDSSGVYNAIASTDYYIKGKNVLVVKWGVTIDVTNNLRIIYAVDPVNLPIELDVALYKLIGDYYTQRTDDGIAQVFRVTENARQMFLPLQDVNQWI